MFIEPNTNIKILRNVPLNNKYKHTLYFSDSTAQLNYFSGLIKHNLIEQTYQRVEKGKMRVSLKAEALYDCNYLMFQNTSFGTKWFYAFITSVEYINNAVSEITFEIDVMQTWYFNYKLKECFVEREHSSVDTIGSNITPENVDTGEYIYSGYEALTYMKDMVVIIAICETDSVDGNIYDGVYNGTTLYAYNSDDVTSINNKLKAYLSSPDSIVSMYTCPKLLVPTVKEGGIVLPYKAGGSALVTSADALTGTEDFDGYTPKNKKLYTYPYNYFHLDNANGTSLTLRYEFFDELKPVLYIDGCVTSPVKIVARPCSYKGLKPYDELAGYDKLNTETLTLEGYPMCSWNTDSYKAWLAQNSVPIMSNMVMPIATAYATGNMLPLANSALNLLSQSYTASIKADICKGNISSGNVNVSNSRQQFYKARVHITSDYAKIIDEYFTMYGYATKRVKVPNISVRPHWNYVKTIDCVITGSIPADDMNNICSIFNNGVTFWKNGSEVGNYSLDNSLEE